MKKSTLRILRLADLFEQKLMSLGDNPHSEGILALQKAITQLLAQDPKAKAAVDQDLAKAVDIGTSSKPGTPWTPGGYPNDEDAYLGERTKRAVYQLTRLYPDIPLVSGEDNVAAATSAIMAKMKASYQPDMPKRSQ